MRWYFFREFADRVDEDLCFIGNLCYYTFLDRNGSKMDLFNCTYAIGAESLNDGQ